MVTLAGIALLLADEGQVERAVELYALASRYPFVANSRWFEDVAGSQITAAVAANLPEPSGRRPARSAARLATWRLPWPSSSPNCAPRAASTPPRSPEALLTGSRAPAPTAPLGPAPRIGLWIAYTTLRRCCTTCRSWPESTFTHGR